MIHTAMTISRMMKVPLLPKIFMEEGNLLQN